MVSADSSRSLVVVAGVALGALVAAPAAANITCCTVDGKRMCGNPAPPQCLARERTEIKGGVARQIEAPPTAEQRAARAEAEARKKEEEKRIAEAKRRDRALLASYSNEDEIDRAMKRSLAEIERNAQQAQNRLEAALNQKNRLEQEKEFYANKPLPEKLQAQIKDNEAEIAAQRQVLQSKEADIAAVRARFEADRQRFRELTGKR